MRLCFVDIGSRMGLWDWVGSAAARLLVVSEAFKRSGRWLRPSFSAHVSGFPARGTTNTRVCGFR